jgi:hypothetical protein
LSLYRILACTIQRLYSKILLNPHEEKLYLPAAEIRFCRNQRRHGEGDSREYHTRREDHSGEESRQPIAGEMVIVTKGGDRPSVLE